MEQQARKLLNLALRLGLVVGTLWLTARFLLPWAAPLLLSFAIAGAMEPLVRLLVRHRWRRGLAAGLTSLTVLALLIWGLSALAAWGASAAGELAGRLPSLLAGLSESLDRQEERLLRLIAQAPEELSDTLRLALDAMGDWLYSLPAELGRWALDALRRLAQRSPDVLLFAVTAGIGSYFCSASWPRLLAFLAAQIPEDWKRRLNGLGADLKGSLGGWLRAQLILMGITFCELLGAFWLLGIESAPGMAALTAFVDALPLFGTGIILAPWALGLPGPGAADRLDRGESGAQLHRGQAPGGSDRPAPPGLSRGHVCGLAGLERVGDAAFPGAAGDGPAAQRSGRRAVMAEGLRFQFSEFRKSRLDKQNRQRGS